MPSSNDKKLTIQGWVVIFVLALQCWQRVKQPGLKTKWIYWRIGQMVKHEDKAQEKIIAEKKKQYPV